MNKNFLIRKNGSATNFSVKFANNVIVSCVNGYGTYTDNYHVETLNIESVESNEMEIMIVCKNDKLSNKIINKIKKETQLEINGDLFTYVNNVNFLKILNICEKAKNYE